MEVDSRALAPFVLLTRFKNRSQKAERTTANYREIKENAVQLLNGEGV
jgi:hypothetical protein